MSININDYNIFSDHVNHHVKKTIPGQMEFIREVTSDIQDKILEKQRRGTIIKHAIERMLTCDGDTEQEQETPPHEATGKLPSKKRRKISKP